MGAAHPLAFKPVVSRLSGASRRQGHIPIPRGRVFPMRGQRLLFSGPGRRGQSQTRIARVGGVEDLPNLGVLQLGLQAGHADPMPPRFPINRHQIALAPLIDPVSREVKEQAVVWIQLFL